MGFSSVYKVLQEIFPQVDSRMLRAVAIEHSKDPDAAVEVVLVEVLPGLSKQSIAHNSSTGSESLFSPTEAAGARTSNQLGSSNLVESVHSDRSVHASPYSAAHDMSRDVVRDSNSSIIVDLVNSDRSVNEPPFFPVNDLLGGVGGDSFSSILVESVHSGRSVPVSPFPAVNDVSGHVHGNSTSSVLVEPVHSDGSVHGSPFYAVNDVCGHSDGSVHGSPFYAVNDVCGHIGEDYRDGKSGLLYFSRANDGSACVGGGYDDAKWSLLQKDNEDNKANLEVPSCSASSASVHGCGASVDYRGYDTSEGQEVNSLGKSEIKGNEVSASVQNAHSTPFLDREETGDSESLNDDVFVDCEDLNQPASDMKEGNDDEHSSANDLQGELMFSNAVVNMEDEFTMNTVVTRSGQICSIDLLEDIIGDARNNKKTLVSAMDSVVSLMKEVDCKEREAEQAKQKAGQGCLDILAKVAEVREAVARAKEANNMHSGEVYAEKAILATEMKELQLRLLNIADERDRSLRILEEMRKELEVRLLAAEKEMEAVELEKLERERSAREALAYQEMAMEKVVEESKLLRQVAEENSKLQDFLMDRGRLVDMLQGEISVKCQDVMLLKENLDRRVPVNKFLSGSQTSSVLAASTSSSVRSTTPPEQVPEMVYSFETQRENVELVDTYRFLENGGTGQVDSSEDLKTRSAASSFHEQLFSQEEKGRDDNIALMDGWELCEDDVDFLANN